MSQKIKSNADVLATLDTLKRVRNGLKNETKAKIDKIIEGIVDHHYGGYIEKD